MLQLLILRLCSPASRPGPVGETAASAALHSGEHHAPSAENTNGSLYYYSLFLIWIFFFFVLFLRLVFLSTPTSSFSL